MTMSKGPYTTWYDKVPGKTVNGKEKIGKRLVTDTFQMELLEEVLILQKCCAYAFICKFRSIR